MQKFFNSIQPVLLPSEIYEFEKEITADGVTVNELIDRASSSIARFILRCIRPHAKVLGFIGKGNNGRDCFETLRKLSFLNFTVGAVFASSELLNSYLSENDLSFLKFISFAEDSEIKEEIKKFRPEVIIDGFFGIGFKPPLPDEIRDIFLHVREIPAFKVSIDVPSGVEALTGYADSFSFAADATVTFFALKPAHLVKPGRGFCGRIFLDRLGFEDRVLDFFKNREVKRFKRTSKFELPVKRSQTAHKKTASVVIIAGSKYMPGAAYLSARAAFSSGAGYVAVASEKKALKVIQTLLPEAVGLPIDFDEFEQEKIEDLFNEYNAAVLGPGFSREEKSLRFTRQIIKAKTQFEIPMVIDGDGLFALSQIEEEITLKNCVITPHPKEAERLLKEKLAPVESAEKLAQKFGCVCIYKGATTVVSDGRQTEVFDEAQNNLATAGTGDVLSGVVASLLAQGLSPFEAAAYSVQAQVEASNSAAYELNGAPITASEVIDYIRNVFSGMCGDY